MVTQITRLKTNQMSLVFHLFHIQILYNFSNFPDILINSTSEVIWQSCMPVAVISLIFLSASILEFNSQAKKKKQKTKPFELPTQF